MNIIDLSSPKHRQKALRRQQDISAEARQWIIRLDSEDMGRDERQVLHEWLQRSPAHRKVFRETAQFWGSLDRLADVLQGEQAQPAPLPQAQGMDDRWFHGAKGLAVAASLVLAIGFMGWRWLPWNDLSSPLHLAVHEAAVGQVRSVILPDGSNIDLNTGTRVEVSFDDSRRAIVLPEGEAYFDVAHDPGKPFVVHAGRYEVKAVGTAFSVTVEDDGIAVLVTEGKVEVSTFGDGIRGTADLEARTRVEAAALAPLERGQRGEFRGDAAGQHSESIAQASHELMRRLSWREGMLVFDNDTLEDVVAAIDRYIPATIQINDDSIRGLRFGGYFSVQDIGAILATIEASYGINVERVGDEFIFLSMAQGDV